MGQTGVQTPWIPLGLYYIWYMEVCSTRIESTSQDNSKVIGLDKSEHQTLKSSSQYVVSEIKHSTCCLRNQAFHMLSQKSSIQFVVSEIKHSICCLRNQAFNLLSQKSSIHLLSQVLTQSWGKRFLSDRWLHWLQWGKRFLSDRWLHWLQSRIHYNWYGLNERSRNDC